MRSCAKFRVALRSTRVLASEQTPPRAAGGPSSVQGWRFRVLGFRV